MLQIGNSITFTEISSPGGSSRQGRSFGALHKIPDTRGNSRIRLFPKDRHGNPQTVSDLISRSQIPNQILLFTCDHESADANRALAARKAYQKHYIEKRRRAFPYEVSDIVLQAVSFSTSSSFTNNGGSSKAKIIFNPGLNLSIELVSKHN